MNKPNVTLAAFCANLAYIDITNRVEITMILPEGPTERGGSDTRYVTLQEGATGRNIAIYGQWYIVSIDIIDNNKFELLIEENPPY